jgi:Raf kinase inhibitor-like YbhB/YbcL family protein
MRVAHALATASASVGFAVPLKMMNSASANRAPFDPFKAAPQVKAIRKRSACSTVWLDEGIAFAKLKYSMNSQEVPMSLQIHSDAFRDGQEIRRKYTGDGENVSPPLRFSGLPKEAKELALIVDDPDAPRTEPFVHWVMYKIPADESDLPEAIPPAAKPKLPPGAMQGKNSFGKIGYGGPAPPAGHGTHHYQFHVYALDEPLQVESGLDKQALLKAMSGHVIDEGEIVATYER